MWKMSKLKRKKVPQKVLNSVNHHPPLKNAQTEAEEMVQTVESPKGLSKTFALGRSPG